MDINVFFMTNSIFRSRYTKGEFEITPIEFLSETFNLS